MDIEELERLIKEEEERSKQWPSLKAHMIRKAARMEGIPTKEYRHRLAVSFNKMRHEISPQERVRQQQEDFDSVTRLVKDIFE